MIPPLLISASRPFFLHFPHFFCSFPVNFPDSLQYQSPPPPGERSAGSEPGLILLDGPGGGSGRPSPSPPPLPRAVPRIQDVDDVVRVETVEELSEVMDARHPGLASLGL